MAFFFFFFETFDPTEFLECIKELVKLDKEWIPNEKGYSLYIRPTVMATEVASYSRFRAQI